MTRPAIMGEFLARVDDLPWINRFNLLPLAPLDGGRAIHALSRPVKRGWP